MLGLGSGLETADFTRKKETYANDGYVILSNIIPDKNLQAMQTDLDKWILSKLNSTETILDDFSVVNQIDTRPIVIKTGFQAYTNLIHQATRNTVRGNIRM